MNDVIPPFRLESRVYNDVAATFEFGADYLAVKGTGSPRFAAGPMTFDMTASKADAVKLAEAILTAFAPEKLASASQGIRRVDGARFSADITMGPFVDPKLLRGGFINVVQGASAPTVAHPYAADAKTEARRLADKAPGKLVLTARIEAVQKAVTKVEEF